MQKTLVLMSVNMKFKLEGLCLSYSKTGCPEEILKFALIIMAENNLEDPPRTVEAKELYLKIIRGLR